MVNNMANTVKIDGDVMSVQMAREQLISGQKAFDKAKELLLLGLDGSKTEKDVEKLVSEMETISEDLKFISKGDKAFKKMVMNLWVFKIEGSRAFGFEIEVLCDSYYSYVHKYKVALMKEEERAGNK